MSSTDYARPDLLRLLEADGDHTRMFEAVFAGRLVWGDHVCDHSDERHRKWREILQNLSNVLSEPLDAILAELPSETNGREAKSASQYWLALIALERFGLMPSSAYDDPQLYFMTHTQNIGGVIREHYLLTGEDGADRRDGANNASLLDSSRLAADPEFSGTKFPSTICGTSIRSIAGGSHVAWVLCHNGYIIMRDLTDCSETAKWVLVEINSSARAVATGAYGKCMALLVSTGQIWIFTAGDERIRHMSSHGEYLTVEIRVEEYEDGGLAISSLGVDGTITRNVRLEGSGGFGRWSPPEIVATGVTEFPEPRCDIYISTEGTRGTRQLNVLKDIVEDGVYRRLPATTATQVAVSLTRATKDQ